MKTLISIVLTSLLFTTVGCGETTRDYMPDSMAGGSLQLLSFEEDYSKWTDKGAYYMNDLGATKCNEMVWYSRDAYRMAAYVNRHSERTMSGAMPVFSSDKAHDYLMRMCKKGAHPNGTVAYAGRFAWEIWIDDGGRIKIH